MSEVDSTVGHDLTVSAVDSPKQTNVTIKLWSSEGKDVTTNLSKACSVKDKTLDSFNTFGFHNLVLTLSDDSTKEYNVNQRFFTSGGNGIVIGLHENPEKSELPDFIVKIGCGRGGLKNYIIDNATRTNVIFSKFDQEFKDNMALYYGDILDENNIKIGEFALYKYLGAEILKYGRLLKTIEGKQKLIKLAIECIQRYQSKNLVHRDVSPENMVYDYRTEQVNLIDFDDMLDFSFLKTEDEDATCILTQGKSRQGDIIRVCMNTGGQEKCIDIFNSQPRPLTPNIISILKELFKRNGEVEDPKQYLQSFLTMDYYGLFWIIIYILLFPSNMDVIDLDVFGLTIKSDYDKNYLEYDRIYNRASKSSLVPKIYEIMPTEYNSNSMIMKFVELVLQLIKDRPADFSLETLLASDFLVNENIEETIRTMERQQDEIDKNDLPLILNEIEKVTNVIQEYINFRKTVRVRRKMLKSNEDFKTKIKTMKGMAEKLSILEEQVGGNQTKYSKHKKTNRYMNKKKIVGRNNTNKKSKTTKLR